MKTSNKYIHRVLIIILALGFTAASSGRAMAHCDTLDGPVATEAMAALNKGDVTPALKWVPKGDEDQLKTAFHKALAVRAKGAEAKELADHYFLETLIRLHRAGEGAPFEGLKPAGTIAPSVAAADRAVETGSVDALAKKMGHAVEEAVHARFAHLSKTRAHRDESVEAGRDYIEAYVAYVHFVEGLHNQLTPSGGHGSVKVDAKHGH